MFYRCAFLSITRSISQAAQGRTNISISAVGSVGWTCSIH